MDIENGAFVTLATEDNYASGALVLAYSLRAVHTAAKLVVMVTTGVSLNTRDMLSKVFDVVQDVSPIDSKDENSLLLMKRPELGVTFTKLHCWKLTQFAKCVFLDADTLVLQNCDELFDREELSAVPDVGWPDCFNSGVFVFKPSVETYKQLMKTAVAEGSFDGGDQGLLNTFFKDWATKDISKHLSFVYNMNVSASYTYLPAYKQFGKNVKIVHFLGTRKPWMYGYDVSSSSVNAPGESPHLYEFLNQWWEIYCQNVDQKGSGASLAKSFSDMSLSPEAKSQLLDNQRKGSTPTSERRASAEDMRMFQWEQGNIDYMGRDSFDNIQKKLDGAIGGFSPDK